METDSNGLRKVKELYYDFCTMFSIDELASNSRLMRAIEGTELRILEEEAKLSGAVIGTEPQTDVQYEFNRLFQLISKKERTSSKKLEAQIFKIQQALYLMNNPDSRELTRRDPISIPVFRPSLTLIRGEYA